MAHSIYDFNKAIAEKAAGDDAFCQRLKSDPRAAIQEGASDLLGQDLALPDDIEITIHYNTPNQVHIVLPHPDAKPAATVKDGDLKSVGYQFSPTYIKCE